MTTRVFKRMYVTPLEMPLLMWTFSDVCNFMKERYDTFALRQRAVRGFGTGFANT